MAEKGGKKKYKRRGMEEDPENSKELSHSARADGMNEYYSPLPDLETCGVKKWGKMEEKGGAG